MVISSNDKLIDRFRSIQILDEYLAVIYIQHIFAKFCLITGATSGIGAAFAKKLASQNYNLIITGRRAEKIKQLAADLIAQYKSDSFKGLNAKNGFSGIMYLFYAAPYHHYCKENHHEETSAYIGRYFIS